MTETQYTTLLAGLAITVGANITAALVAPLINNNRLGDVRDALRAEIHVVRSELESFRSEIRAELDGKLAGLRESILTQMATYQMDIISKIAELDNRVTRIERH